MGLRVPDPFHRYVIHPLEAAGVVLSYGFFSLLPISLASNLGGWLGRTIGPRLGLSRRATKNLEKAFPEKGADEIAEIVRGMWDNLGRIVGEYPHLKRLDFYAPDGRVEVIGAENIEILRSEDTPGIFFSAHLGNWEIVSLGASQKGLALQRIYREANNRLVEWLFQRGRSAVKGELIPKGPQGARFLLRVLKEGKNVAMLVDQKMNDGIPVPFFGRDAMTAPALADLALRFNCPVIPARAERLSGARFRLTIYPPMELTKTGDRKADVIANMAKVNALIESWIRERPEQWLWVHNRWPD
jgi:Kdo2-lipid IVA lauroyltransferase/acyltransferase